MSDQNDLERRLRKLAEATNSLSPSELLTDSIMARVAESDDPLDRDARLSALTEATRDLDVAPAFTDAVLRLVEEPARTSKRPVLFLDGLARAGRTGLFVAAAIAAAAVVYASWTERRVYDETMVSADTIEVVE